MKTLSTNEKNIEFSGNEKKMNKNQLAHILQIISSNDDLFSKIFEVIFFEIISTQAFNYFL